MIATTFYDYSRAFLVVNSPVNFIIDHGDPVCGERGEHLTHGRSVARHLP